MNRNKAAGPGRIVIETLPVLDAFGVNKNTAINEIYVSGDIPEYLSKSIFVAGPNECKFHRTISLCTILHQRMHKSDCSVQINELLYLHLSKTMGESMK